MIRPLILIRKRIIPIKIPHCNVLLRLNVFLLIICQQDRLIQPAVIILGDQLILQVRTFHLDIRNALI